MNTELVGKIENKFIIKTPKFSVGDTIAVHTIIRSKTGEKRRVQVFKGLVIAIKGSGTRKTFTIRKISYGIGVEKIYPLYSPNIEKIELIKKGNVRRSKLYYMRKRIGKKAMKVDEGEFSEDDYLSEEEIKEADAEVTEDLEPETEVEAAEEQTASDEEKAKSVEKSEKKEDKKGSK